jgi:hypothetical protein
MVFTDAEYRALLLRTLGVCEATDPAHAFTIAELEEHIVSAGIDLPIVRRVQAEGTHGTEPQ